MHNTDFVALVQNSHLDAVQQAAEHVARLTKLEAAVDKLKARLALEAAEKNAIQVPTTARKICM